MVTVIGTNGNDKPWLVDYSLILQEYIVFGGLQGTNSADTIDGKGGNDGIWGWGGDDWLYGGEGEDEIRGGDGNDFIFGGDGHDLYLAGEDGDDFIDGGSGYNVLYGYSGNDTLLALNGTTGSELNGGSGDDTYIIDSDNDFVMEYAGDGYDRVLFRGSIFKTNGGTGTDPDTVYTAEIEEIIYDGPSKTSVVVGGTATSNIIRTKDGTDTILSYGGNDTVYAGGAYDKVWGGKGNDKLFGEYGNDELWGEAGDDLLDGGDGGDRLYGGIGDDRYIIDCTVDAVVGETAGGGFDTVESSVLTTMALAYDPKTGSDMRYVEGLTYTGFDAATLTGNTLDNKLSAMWANGATMDGGDGKDTIWGSNAADHLYGGDGHDSLLGRGGGDTLDGGFGNDAMYGGDGDDTYVVGDGGDKVKEKAGEGYDTVKSWIDYVLAENVERAELLSDNGGTLIGNALNNALYASKVTGSILSGAGGNDKLVGGSGNDTLNGGTGDDWMHGGFGNDTYRVDSSLDKVYEYAGNAHDTILTTTSYSLNDTASGFVEDLIAEPMYKSVTLTGNSQNNTIKGAALGDVLNGNGGSDTLHGLGGSDVLLGGKGKDFLFGGDSDDMLFGEAGWDSLTGGDGADVFYFKSGDAHDTILDFEDHVDRIAVTGGHASDLSLVQSAAGVTVSFDGLAFSVLLAGVSAADVTAADFVFI